MARNLRISGALDQHSNTSHALACDRHYLAHARASAQPRAYTHSNASARLHLPPSHLGEGFVLKCLDRSDFVELVCDWLVLSSVVLFRRHLGYLPNASYAVSHVYHACSWVRAHTLARASLRNSALAPTSTYKYSSPALVYPDWLLLKAYIAVRYDSEYT
eukprot:6171988-Pleurochrysis_carterae.AAC.1